MADGRKNNGGRRPNSGRKGKAEEMGLAALLDKCWGAEKREQVITSLHSQAADGNTQAAALLLAYAFGKPTEKHSHSGADGGPIVLKVIYG